MYLKLTQKTRRAEREGFEPSIPLRIYDISNVAHSATMRPLQAEDIIPQSLYNLSIGRSRRTILKSDKELHNPLLEGPQTISPEEESQKQKDLGFNFHFGNSSKAGERIYRLGLNGGQAYLAIVYVNNLPESLSAEEKSQFQAGEEEVDGQIRTVYISRYGPVPPPRQKPSGETVETPPGTPPGYLIDKRREFKNQTTQPELITLNDQVNFQELAQRLKNSRLLFYTGAGISVAGGVHGMDQLHEAMHFDPKSDVDEFVKLSLRDPEEILREWVNFTKNALNSPPTQAHIALANIANTIHYQIFTENVDTLQEMAGVEPIRVSGQYLRDNIKSKWLREIDYIVTVGLSHDDRGFLGWYKRNNPQGKIVAVDLKQPNYLGNEDTLISGDLQEIIPELEKDMLSSGEQGQL